MKKLFVALALVLTLSIVVFLGVERSVVAVKDDGYAVPTSTGVAQSLSAGKSVANQLTKVNYDDMVYQSIEGFFVGEERNKIDITYPLYVNGGAGLRFLNEDVWLVDSDVILQQTYEGMYLSNGDVYDFQMEQSDAHDNYILLTLNNGLFMNAQQMTVNSQANIHDVPANSIIRFDKDALRWYEYDKETLTYKEENILFQATLEIGGNTYDYAEFLKALGLINEAISLENKDKDSSEVQDLAAQELESSKVDSSSSSDKSDKDKDKKDEEGDKSDKDKDNSGSSSSSGSSDSSDSDSSTDAGDNSGNTGDGSPETDDDSSEVKPDDGDKEENDDDADQGSGETDPGAGDLGDTEDDHEQGGSGNEGDAGTDDGTDHEGEPDGSGGDSSGGEVDPPKDEDIPDIDYPQGDDDADDNGVQMGYVEPTIWIGDMEAWSYAIGAELHVFDPAATVVGGGITVNVYSSVDTTKEPTKTYTDPRTEKVYRAYDKDYVDGRATKVRVKYNSSGHFPMAELVPNTTYYIQYSYKYNKITTSEDDPDVNVSVRVEEKSDLIEITTSSADDKVTVHASWNEGVAVDATGMSLTNITLENSDKTYQPDLEKFSFDNFKKNIVPYVDTVVFNLQKLKADGTVDTSKKPVEIELPYSTLNNAKKGMANFLSNDPALESNSVYQYTVLARDRASDKDYIFPFYIKTNNTTDYIHQPDFTGIISTCKQTPTVTMEEVENVPDKLTLKFTVSDPDKAITSDKIKLTATDFQGNVSAIYGYGETTPTTSLNSNVEFGSNNTNEIILEKAQDGATYYLRIESLAFARFYEFVMTGEYCEVPDSIVTGDKPTQEGIFGVDTVYTQALSSGNVGFTTEMLGDDVRDNSVKFSLQMNDKTTVELLPLVDEYRFKLSAVKPTSKDKEYECVFNEKALNKNIMTDIDMSLEEDEIITYKIPNFSTTEGLTVNLVGAKKDFVGKTVWEAINIALLNPEIGVGAGYKNPLKIEFVLAENTLNPKTEYNILMESVVIKSNEDKYIPTTLTDDAFYTKSTIPTLEYDSIFLAGDTLDMKGIYVKDIDGTIQNDDVQIELIYGNVTLNIKEIEDSIKYDRLIFEDLIENQTYTVRFVAPIYKDTVDSNLFERNKVIAELTLVAGSNLNGKIILNSVDYNVSLNKYKDLYTIDGEAARTAMATALSNNYNGARTDYMNWSKYSTNLDFGYYTNIMRLPEDGAQFIYVPDYAPPQTELAPYRAERYNDGKNAGLTSVDVYYYKLDAKGAPVLVGSSNESCYTLDGRTPMFYVPEDAQFYRFLIPDAKPDNTTTYQNGEPVLEMYQESHIVENGFSAKYIPRVTGYDAKETDLLACYGDYGQTGPQGGTLYEHKTLDATTGKLTDNTTYDTLMYVPVTPGSVYVKTKRNIDEGKSQYNFTNKDGDKFLKYYSDGGVIYFYTADKGYVGYQALNNNAEVVIPENVAYASFTQYTGTGNTHWGSIIQVIEGPAISDKDKFATSISVTSNYRGAQKDLDVTVTLQHSDSMDEPIYTDTGKSCNFTLTQDVNDPALFTLQLTEEQQQELKNMTSNLSAYDGWKIVLSTIYDGKYYQLDAVEFRTDMAYRAIHDTGSHIKMEKNRFLNYIVTEDFVYDNDAYHIVLYGTFDGQSHKITRADNGRNVKSVIYNCYGTAKNFAYDFPAGIENEYMCNTVSYINGTVKNVVVTLNGDIKMKKFTSPLMSYAVEAGGLLENFIVNLKGDVVFDVVENDTNSAAAFVRYSRGTIRNGYIYSTNGSGIVIRDNETGTSGSSSGFIASASIGSVVENVFTMYDVWIETQNDVQKGAVWSYQDIHGDFLSSYHVGESYVYDPMYGKTNKKNSIYNLLGKTTTLSNVKDVWALTTNPTAYALNSDTIGRANLTSTAQLSDMEWQAGILGDGFDTSLVERGFYPRLNLPLRMQPYQEYIQLPDTITEEVPVLIDDRFAEGFEYDPFTFDVGTQSAKIKLVFQNNNRATINNIDINGMKVIEIEKQEMNSEGNYEVTLEVMLDSENLDYKSNYYVGDITYVVSGKTMLGLVNKNTENIKFYKPVYTVADWTAINSNMDWNYILANDIVFNNDEGNNYPNATKANLSQIIIRGTGSFDSRVAFTGELDGNNKSLLNITIENSKAPWVFAYLQGATIKDLTVDNMYISSRSSTVKQTGFIGESSSHNNLLDNIHIKNSTVIGEGIVGGLLAKGNNEMVISNCSVTDTTISDMKSTYAATFGGIAGYMHGSRIENSFTRNVDINVSNTPAIQYVGGILGTTPYTTMMNCYSNGTIKAIGSYVGGIVGSHKTLVNCWSDVDIDVTGNYVGGIAAMSTDPIKNMLVLGDVIATGADTHRISGVSTGSGLTNPTSNLYAYEGQSVVGVKPTDVDGATGILSGTELRQRAIWIDDMEMGTTWDYDKLTKGFLPFVYSTHKDANGNQMHVENQVDLKLPTAGDAHAVQIIDSLYDEANAFPYSVKIEISHPDVERADLADMLMDGAHNTEGNIKVTDEVRSINAIGMNSETAKMSTPGAVGKGDYVSEITIQYKDFIQAFDNYRMIITYGEYELVTAYHYTDKHGEEYYVYHDPITNIDEWNTMMSKDDGIHQISSENFKIDGFIDFANDTNKYHSLRIGRLEGVISEDEYGFRNLSYSGGYNGDLWIDNVATNLENLTFENMTVNFGATNTTRQTSGFIGYATIVKDLILRQISIKEINPYCNNSVGFIGEIKGTVEGLLVEKLKDDTGTVSDKASISITSASGSDYHDRVGGVAGKITGGFKDVVASDIEIILPPENNGQYVGSLFGFQEYLSFYPTNDNVTVSDCKIVARDLVAGVIGYGLRTSTNFKVSNMDIEAKLRAGGVSTQMWANLDGFELENIYIHGDYPSNITGSYARGGLVSNISAGNSIKNTTLKNVNIQSKVITGLLIGEANRPNITNVSIIDSSITDEVSSKTSKYRYAGGLFGKLVDSYANIKNVALRDVDVTGYDYAGGIVGYATANNNVKLNNVYVSEDCQVTALKGPAGGIAGELTLLHAQDVAIGADVTGSDYVGGLVGRVPQLDDTYTTIDINDTYYNGTVTGNNFVSAVVGAQESLMIDDMNINGLVLAGRVNASGTDASIWMNDLAVYEENAKPYTNIALYDKFTLNGQSYDNIIQAPEPVNIYLPEDTKIRNADWFADKQSYIDMGFSENQWSYTHMVDDNPFMPFIYDSTTGTDILKYSNKDLADHDVGILLPQIVTDIREDISVYPTGVDTINIEVYLGPNTNETPAKRSCDITVNGKTVTATTYDAYSEYACVTLNYNFKDDLAITTDSIARTVNVTASELTRTVSNFDTYWFALDKDDEITGYNKVTYGDYGAVKGNLTTSATEIVHLWLDKVIDKAGNIYQVKVTPDKAVSITGVGAMSGNSLDVKSTTVPLLSYTLSGRTVNVYSNYTTYGVPAIGDVRLFAVTDATSTKAFKVSNKQGILEDGVALNYNMSVTSKFFLLLQNDNIVDQLGNAKFGDTATTSVAHISNNFASDNSIMAIRYLDGTLAVVNYTNGKEVYTTVPEPTLPVYISNAMNGIFNNFFYAPSVNGYQSTEDLLDQVQNEHITDLESPLGAAPDDSQGIPGGNETDDLGGEDIDGVIGSAGIEDGKDTEGDAEHQESDKETDQGGDGEESTEKEEDTATGDYTPPTVTPNTGLAYIPGQGVYVEGEKVLTSGDATYIPGNGVYVKGELVYFETGANDIVEENGVLVDTNGTRVEQIALEKAEDVYNELTDAIGQYTVAMNDKNGKYEIVETESLLKGEEVSLTKDAIEKLDEIAIEKAENSLLVGNGIGHTLTHNQENGFNILKIMAVLGLALLVVIYFKVKRKE